MLSHNKLDFAGSDVPLTAEERRARDDLVTLPTLAG